jgi:LysM repeat protein
MRVFFFLVLFFLGLLLFANSSMAAVDLTPNTPEDALASGFADPSTPSQPQVLQIQESLTMPRQTGAMVPVTGGCSDPYTVRSGDTLSQIAVMCGTTLAFLTQVNPQIPNVNCMYPGQQINIRNGSMVLPPAPCRVAAAQNAVSPPLNVPVPVVALPADCACYTSPVPVSGLRPMIIPGSGLQVTALNFPPNTPVNVAIGPRTTGYTVVASGVTNSNGSLILQIAVPTAPDSQIPWVVVVLTTTTSPIQIMSEPFYIGLSAN